MEELKENLFNWYNFKENSDILDFGGNIAKYIHVQKVDTKPEENKKYENLNDDRDDLLSIGIIGLIKGVDTFNHNANNKLATYAARCIENEILMHIRSNKNKKNVGSLNSSIGLDKDGNDIKLIDIVKDEAVGVMDSMILDESITKLNKALKLLSKREYEIISRRYGLNQREAETQKEIASKMKISRSYVSRIEKRALMKLYLELLE